MDIASELAKMQKKIEAGKQNKMKLEAKWDSALERLNTEFGLQSIEEVKNKIDKLGEELDAKEDLLEKKFNELKEKFPWPE